VLTTPNFHIVCYNFLKDETYKYSVKAAVKLHQNKPKLNKRSNQSAIAISVEVSTMRDYLFI